MDLYSHNYLEGMTQAEKSFVVILRLEQTIVFIIDSSADYYFGVIDKLFSL